MSLSGPILIVDDEKHIRMALRMMLKRRGYDRIVEASNGSEAVGLFTEHRPALVLLDLNMPHMDGLACLGEIRKTGIPAKIVVLTAQANVRSVQECRDAGADGFLRKDSPSEEIVGIVQEMMAD
jgi:CheY-like chemotaxis protein